MVEFFRGWRRKLGLMTLVLACIAMLAWARSFSILDLLMFSDTKLTSTRGALYWERGFPESTPTQTRKFSLTDTYFFHSAEDVGDNYQIKRIKKNCRWHYFGLVTCEYDSGDYSGVRMKFWRFPYWWIGLRLSLLSTWLLLGKPRAKKIASTESLLQTKS